jgi:hypothetical protein
VRYGEDAWQRSPLPFARKKTHGKDVRARQTRVFPLCPRVGYQSFIHYG